MSILNLLLTSASLPNGKQSGMERSLINLGKLNRLLNDEE